VAVTLIKLAGTMGYHTIAAALAEDHDKTAGADQTLNAFDLSGLGLSERDAVVVATQGKRDREALTQALVCGAGYVGMVGSRRKIATLLDQLGRDVPAAAKAVLHGPAGLDIGAIDPEEIALSIIGEIVMERRRAMQTGSAESAGAAPDTEVV